MKFLALITAVCASCLLLTHCGGGGSDSAASAPTVRPKTMDGVILTLDNCVRIAFLRNIGTPAALNSGDVETGTFYYTSLVGQVNLRTYNNIKGDMSNLWWPQTASFTNYTYRAINDSSGVLTLNGKGSIQDNYFTFDWGTQRVANNSSIIPFIHGSYDYSKPPVLNTSYWYSTETSVVEIDLTFVSNGSTVSANTVTFSLPESSMLSSFDTVRMPVSAILAVGGPIPVNYNPTLDPLRASKIAPATLTNSLLTATNGAKDTTKNFSIQFVADASQTTTGSGSSAKPDEVGHGLLRVNGSPVDVALDYTWRRVGGTDTGVLVLSNIPDDPLDPFHLSLNGSYTLSFGGTENGTYVGQVDADTANIADVSGTFNLQRGN